MLTTILVTLIGGTIIGLLGKFVAPGDRDNIPLWLTIICGIGGMLIGNFLYPILPGADCTGSGLSVDCTKGIDVFRHLIQVAVAAALVVAAALATGRGRKV